MKLLYDALPKGASGMTPLRKAAASTRRLSGKSCLEAASFVYTPISQRFALRAMSTTQPRRALNIDNVNPHVRAAEYAVRGELAVKSEEYRHKLANGEKLPFDSVISANIGNPQQLDQKPITFFRQVLSLLENPLLLEQEEVLLDKLGYKSDAVNRAKWLLKEVGSVGAYSASAGVHGIRQSVARFIERRDGYPADPNQIYLTAGASAGVNTLLHIICAGPSTGVLVPIPQYPLYTATLTLLNAKCVPYYLDEAKHWATDISSIEFAVSQARDDGTDVRAICVINPGNPTGASLSYADVKATIALAAKEKLVIIADEVYQTNVFIGKFHSFKSVLRDMQREEPGKYDDVELCSLHSVSKGVVGECGHRGGYFELVGFDPEVVEQIYKFISITLCAPVIGQALVELMVNPPKQGEPSFELYQKETNGISSGLQARATTLYKTFNELEGYHCNDPQGAMYLFPTIKLPKKALEQAVNEGRTPDELYCLRMLEATGVCVVPGSGFGQKEGTLHFRTTFLAPGTDWAEKIKTFHEKFMDEFR